MSNSVQKAVKLLQSAKYSNSKLDDIYDFLYASYISGEAEQMHDERKVKNALRHYEGLDGEMEYKSKSLNKRLASIKEEIQSIKAELNKQSGYTSAADLLLEQAAKKFRMKKEMESGKIVYTKRDKNEVSDNRSYGNYVVDAFFDVTLSESKGDSSKIDIYVLADVQGDMADHSETISAKSLSDLGRAVSDTKSNALNKIMRY